LQNKKTLLALKVMESASAADQAELEHWLSAPSDEPDAKIAAVRALFDRNDIPARIADEKDQFRQLAFDRLDAVSAPEARKQALRDAVGALLDREN